MRSVRRYCTLLAFVCLPALVSCVEQGVRDEHPTDKPLWSAKVPKENLRIGTISAAELLAQYPKFNEEYQSYETEADDIKLIEQLNGYDLTVVLGVWCHDSEREVPRFLKLLDAAHIDLNSLQLIAVNLKKELPEGIDPLYSVAHTPTFFVSKDHQILAKLVEKPKQSIAKDLLSQILF